MSRAGALCALASVIAACSATTAIMLAVSAPAGTLPIEVVAVL